MFNSIKNLFKKNTIPPVKLWHEYSIKEICDSLKVGLSEDKMVAIASYFERDYKDNISEERNKLRFKHISNLVESLDLISSELDTTRKLAIPELELEIVKTINVDVLMLSGKSKNFAPAASSVFDSYTHTYLDRRIKDGEVVFRGFFVDEDLIGKHDFLYTSDEVEHYVKNYDLCIVFNAGNKRLSLDNLLLIKKNKE